MDEDEKALQQAKDRGITIFKGGDDFTKRMDAYRDEERKSILNSMKELGVREPDQLMDKFLSLNATWEKLSEQMKNDVGKFADALRERVYRKIDPEKL
jgi:hypothetical protein